MKKFNFHAVRFLSLGLIAGMVAVSCDDDDNNTTPSAPSEAVISGDITSNRLLSADTTYLLTGGVHVKSGVTLTIDAGTRIESNPSEAAVAYLLIERGAKIMAEGTAASPIIFTSGEDTPARGDWGGVILCGYAPINKGSEATSEVGDALYGGTNAADNSGVLKYVRAEYTGNAISDTKEHNGFSFCGVGNQTVVDHVQVYLGNDDGFEFFGGTVNAKYLISYGSKDDSFDWTYGWSGKGQFWLAIQATDKGDRGIEADNNGSDNAATPYSNPILSNITLVGANDAEDEDNTGMRLREGTKGKIYNAIVTGFPNAGLRVTEAVTEANVTSGDLFVKNSEIFSNGENFKDCSAFELDTSNSSNIVTISNGVGTATGGYDVSADDSWFTSTDYKGAVSSSNNWTAGWSVGL